MSDARQVGIIPLGEILLPALLPPRTARGVALLVYNYTTTRRLLQARDNVEESSPSNYFALPSMIINFERLGFNHLLASHKNLLLGRPLHHPPLRYPSH